MSVKIRTRRLRALIRRLHRRRARRVAALWLLSGVVAVSVPVLAYKHLHPTIDPAAYNPLLGVIAKGESNGNYDAYYGNAGNTAIRFTDMSVGQVLTWQYQYVHQQGSPSSAVGRYQIIRPTLLGLTRQLHIKPDARFSAALQDRLAIALIVRRGSIAYVQQKLTRQQFAAALAQEWASLPRATEPDPQQSYYAGDGLNAARVDVGQVYGALDSLKR